MLSKQSVIGYWSHFSSQYCSKFNDILAWGLSTDTFKLLAGSLLLLAHLAMNHVERVSVCKYGRAVSQTANLR